MGDLIEPAFRRAQVRVFVRAADYYMEHWFAWHHASPWTHDGRSTDGVATEEARWFLQSIGAKGEE